MKIFIREIVWWYHAAASTLLTMIAHWMRLLASMFINIGVASLTKSKYHVDKL